ncbi:MAG: glycosyltransferase family 2 protein [Clostridia bacterium]|nr:glycosyltransferase family 2 protein [Clostridia bacterium]
MIDATAIIMTKNEEKNIVDCLKSMEGFAKRCVVIDCGSTDGTVALAEECGADVYFHEFEYYAKQFNWGIDNCNIDTEWIIRLDADERFPEKLCREIEEIIADDKTGNVNGITIEADFFFLGRCMKHGPRNKRKMMLFKRSVGRIEDRRRDAHSIISEGVSVSTKGRFLHYDFKDLDNYVKRYNWYATREMQDYIDFTRGASTEINGDRAILAQRKKKFGFYYKMPKYFRAWAWFIYNYIFRGGFLDGREGLVFCFLECYWYRLLVDAKIFEYQKRGESAEFEKLKAID